MAELLVQSLELELSIGDTIQIGDQFLTVVDIEGDEILFQLDSGDPPNPKPETDSNSQSYR
ncbi:hypothetical protein V202x_28670 [Gimesia aquarii]|uniref:Carbon storage regulator n=1 Tax=Gimesia aquarii TaxID=2527964 RepID=A0A517WWA7_9PLAN|nr:hypothetical protein V202x_28670 [Gimesia aquarii]